MNAIHGRTTTAVDRPCDETVSAIADKEIDQRRNHPENEVRPRKQGEAQERPGDDHPLAHQRVDAGEENCCGDLRLHAGHPVEDLVLVEGQVAEREDHEPLRDPELPTDACRTDDRNDEGDERDGAKREEARATVDHLSDEWYEHGDRRREPVRGGFARVMSEAHPVGRVPRVRDGDEPILEATIGHHPEDDSRGHSRGGGTGRDRVRADECRAAETRQTRTYGRGISPTAALKVVSVASTGLTIHRTVVCNGDSVCARVARNHWRHEMDLDSLMGTARRPTKPIELSGRCERAVSGTRAPVPLRDIRVWQLDEPACNPWYVGAREGTRLTEG